MKGSGGAREGRKRTNRRLALEGEYAEIALSKRGKEFSRFKGRRKKEKSLRPKKGRVKKTVA